MNEATMPIRMFNASKSNLFSESVPPVTASESVISVKLNETSSLVVSQTTTQLSRQVTPSLLPIEDKSSVVGMLRKRRLSDCHIVSFAIQARILL